MALSVSIEGGQDEPPLRPVFQGEAAPVGVRLQEAHADRRVGFRQVGGAGSVDEQDVDRSAVSPRVRLFPVGAEEIGVHPGVGDEASVPQLCRGLPQVGEDPQSHAVRLPGGEGEPHDPLRPEDGEIPVQPVDVLEEIPVGLGVVRHPRPGGIAPGIGGGDAGGQRFLPAGIGQGRRAVDGDPPVPQGLEPGQQSFPAALTHGPPEGSLPPDVPVLPEVEAQGGPVRPPDPRLPDLGDQGVAFALARYRLRFLRLRLRQDPGIGGKQRPEGVFSLFRLQLAVAQGEAGPVLPPGQLRQPGVSGEPGPDPFFPRLGGNGAVQQRQQGLPVLPGAGGAEAVPPSPQGDVALRPVRDGDIRRPYAGDAAGRQEVLQQLGLGSGRPPPAQGQDAPVLPFEECRHPPGEAVRPGGNRLGVWNGKGQGIVVFPGDPVRPRRLRLLRFPAAAGQQDQREDQDPKQGPLHGETPPLRFHPAI